MKNISKKKNIMFTVPNKLEIQKRYESYRPVFNLVLEKIESRLKEKIQLASNLTYKARIKSFESYYKKILMNKAEEAGTSKTLVTLTDMIGIRIICPFVEDLADVEKSLVASFDVKEIERKGNEHSFSEFGYESVHILIAIPSDCLPEKSDPVLPENLVCEIQVRTILQDAWAEVEHELIYKSEFNPFDKPLRRKLASINASLVLADIIFQEIRDYQKNIRSELKTRRGAFYGKVDEYSDAILGRHNQKSIEPALVKSPYTKGSVDDLVLTALHEHNCGNFEKAIEVYTQLVTAEPPLPDTVLSVIYKHRGMAYFAQNLYDKALYDFHQSSTLDPKGFRSIYYEGIILSIQGKDKEAIACFDHSLEVNSFQSHVYYRRALSFYNIGEYAKAMSDVNSAFSLGMDDEDLRTLKANLMQKFDMKM